jgi:hypothetical protein
MTGSIPPNEFQYRDDDTFAWMSLFLVAAVLLLSSVVTGVWGIAALAHGSWLDANDLPGAGATTWGIGMLVLASVQGITAILIVFGRPLGTVLGIAIAVLTILADLAVISAFPVGSLVSIGVNLVIIAVLFAFRPGR